MSERAGATVSETAASHSLYVSKPDATADVIKQAAQQALTGGPRGRVMRRAAAAD